MNEKAQLHDQIDRGARDLPPPNLHPMNHGVANHAPEMDFRNSDGNQEMPRNRAAGRGRVRAFRESDGMASQEDP